MSSGRWEIGTLNVNQETVLHIICKVNSTGIIENNVSVSGSERDYDLTNNFDSKIVAVDPSSDLLIEKSVNVSEVNFGDLVKWTLVISNNGPDNATGVYVVDVLPEGFIYQDSILDKGNYSQGIISIGNLAVGEKLTLEIICLVNATGNFTNTANITGRQFDYNLTNNADNESIFINPACDLEVIKEVDESNPDYNDTIVWTITVKNNGPEIDQLSSGDSAILNILCRVNGTGFMTNHANVTAREFDYNLTNNEDDETIEVNASADLSIEKLVNNSNPNYGEYIVWTLIIKNNGPDKANGVYVEENLPEGLILINYTASKGIFDNNVWVMCCLNNSEVQTLEIICQVNKTGNITNFVTISSDEYDPNPENNEDNETIEVPPSVDLELFKEVDNLCPDYGDEIVWTITVINNGPDNATGVRVEDLMSQGLIVVDWNATRGNYFGQTWEIGHLDVGCSEQLNITCITNQLGEITNYAEVKSNEYDWNEANNYDAAYVEVAPVVDLAIEKLVNNTNPNYNDLVKWTLIVTNYGPNDASDVFVSDILPEGLTFVKSNSNDYSDGIWDIGYLNAGDSVILEIISKISATGNFTNGARVSCYENDPNESNNYDEASIAVPPASDISITKTVSKYNHNLGDLIEYAIRIYNNGPDRASNVVVNEFFDDSLSLRSFKASTGNFNKLSKTWDVESLDFGESASLLIKAVATEEGISNNTIRVSSDNYDPDLSNNEDSAFVNVSRNSQKIPIMHKKAKVDKHVFGKKFVNEIKKGLLEKNVSGNYIFLLLISLVFSIAFLGDGISKKR